MVKLMQKIDMQKIVAVLVLSVVLFLSMNVFSKEASDPENHRETIEALDEKKADVLKLTATSAAASTALAAIPGDATTPVANKLADLTSYFMIILMVVFLEKYLVTLTGYAAFSILVPVSMNVSAIIEQTYDLTVETAVEEAQDITDEINESTDSEGNIIDKALSKIKDGVDGLLEKGETLLNHFVETIAVMLVTSCMIPVVVLLFMLWFVRILFGIQINLPQNMPKRIASKFPGYKDVSEKDKKSANEEIRNIKD